MQNPHTGQFQPATPIVRAFSFYFEFISLTRLAAWNDCDQRRRPARALEQRCAAFDASPSRRAPGKGDQRDRADHPRATVDRVLLQPEPGRRDRVPPDLPCPRKQAQVPAGDDGGVHRRAVTGNLRLGASGYGCCELVSLLDVYICCAYILYTDVFLGTHARSGGNAVSDFWTPR